ncbi:MAG: 4Fe-4S binding protein [Acidobacteriota bacterium]
MIFYYYFYINNRVWKPAGRCTGCVLCIKECPFEAIEVRRTDLNEHPFRSD